MEFLNRSCQLALLFLYIHLVLTIKHDKYLRCGPGILTGGVTHPEGDIKIEYGHPLEILCVLDSAITNVNSSSLVFYRDDIAVPDEFVNIVNTTTLRLFIKNPSLSNHFFSCQIQHGNEYVGVCANYVSVGTKPQEVKNFSCISFNWESLNCSWVPVPNSFFTTYKLSFSLQQNSRNRFECPGNSDVLYNYCFWNSSSNPPYRMPYSMYYFILVGSNDLGNLTTNYKINHYGIVVPGKPENLHIIGATPFSVAISWSIPLALKEFPIDIDSKVMYQSSWDPPTSWVRVNSSNIIKNGHHRILNITCLKYANTLYDIQVSIKSSQAVDLNKMWSEKAFITAKTKPAIPKIPPMTAIGSFESFPRAFDPSHRNVYIYWQIIPKKYENGEHFGYNITKVNEIVDGMSFERDIKPIIHDYYAFFENLSYNTYTFQVVSINKEGFSANFSTVIVPSNVKTLNHPVTFKKVVYDRGLFELSWRPATSTSVNNVIENYTIFWCTYRSNACDGLINWTLVSGTVTNWNVSLESGQTYQFAISANNIISSSGMIWTPCTVLQDQVERQYFESVWVNSIGSSYIELGWKLKCINSKVSEFVVEYCPISSIKQSQCASESMKIRKFNESLHSSRYKITNLSAYSTYLVHFFLVYTNDSLISRETLINSTSESVPDGPPTNLIAIHITNTSVTVSWRPPAVPNGIIRYYRVSCNSKYILVKSNSSVVEYKFDNLSSFEFYSVSVSACTIGCSRKTASLMVQTGIGIPGILSAPVVSYYNETHFNITWFPLKSGKGGENDYYEIKVQMLNEQKINIIDKQVVKFKRTHNMHMIGGKMEILTEGCQELNTSTFYTVQVRAVNVDHQNNVIYEGPWSPSAEGFCHATLALSFSYIASLAVPGIIFLFILIAFAANKIKNVWKCYKEASNVNINLPADLELAMHSPKSSLESLPPGLSLFEIDHQLKLDKNALIELFDSFNERKSVVSDHIDSPSVKSNGITEPVVCPSVQMNVTNSFIDAPNTKENFVNQLLFEGDCGNIGIRKTRNCRTAGASETVQNNGKNVVFLLRPGEGYITQGRINLLHSSHNSCKDIGSLLYSNAYSINKADLLTGSEEELVENIPSNGNEKCGGIGIVTERSSFGSDDKNHLSTANGSCNTNSGAGPDKMIVNDIYNFPRSKDSIMFKKHVTSNGSDNYEDISDDILPKSRNGPVDSNLISPNKMRNLITEPEMKAMSVISYFPVSEKYVRFIKRDNPSTGNKIYKNTSGGAKREGRHVQGDDILMISCGNPHFTDFGMEPVMSKLFTIEDTKRHNSNQVMEKYKDATSLISHRNILPTISPRTYCAALNKPRTYMISISPKKEQNYLLSAYNSLLDGKKYDSAPNTPVGSGIRMIYNSSRKREYKLYGCNSPSGTVSAEKNISKTNFAAYEPGDDVICIRPLSTEDFNPFGCSSPLPLMTDSKDLWESNYGVCGTGDDVISILPSEREYIKPNAHDSPLSSFIAEKDILEYNSAGYKAVPVISVQPHEEEDFKPYGHCSPLLSASAAKGIESYTSACKQRGTLTSPGPLEEEYSRLCGYARPLPSIIAQKGKSESNSLACESGDGEISSRPLEEAPHNLYGHDSALPSMATAKDILESYVTLSEPLDDIISAHPLEKECLKPYGHEGNLHTSKNVIESNTTALVPDFDVTCSYPPGEKLKDHQDDNLACITDFSNMESNSEYDESRNEVVINSANNKEYISRGQINIPTGENGRTEYRIIAQFPSGYVKLLPESGNCKHNSSFT